MLERLLLLGSALQLELHVLEPEIVRNHAAIILRFRLAAHVARKPDQISFIDVLRNAGARVPPHVDRLRVGKREGELQCQDTGEEGGKSQSSRHRSLEKAGSNDARRGIVQGQKNDRSRSLLFHRVYSNGRLSLIWQ